MATPRIAVGTLPSPVDLSLYQGDDFYLDLTVTNSDGSPADLTGATPKAQIRTTAADATVLAEFVATITTNVIHLHLTAALTAPLSGPAVWDCQITTPDVVTLVAGTVTIRPEVTR